LAYDAPEGCPVQQEFVAAVATRGGDFDGTGGAAARDRSTAKEPRQLAPSTRALSNVPHDPALSEL
jgi:hypothetical protein